MMRPELESVDHVRRIVLGLGSNVGDRAAQITAAIDALRRFRDLHVLRRSPLYESAPAGGPPQPDYVNAAVLLVTSLSARVILERALTIERSLGRHRPDPERWGPRTIDVDILWVEGEVIDEPGLSVPHPRLAERPFALRPLLDLAPDATDSGTGRGFASLDAASVPLRLLVE